MNDLPWRITIYIYTHALIRTLDSEWPFFLFFAKYRLYFLSIYSSKSLMIASIVTLLSKLIFSFPLNLRTLGQYLLLLTYLSPRCKIRLESTTLVISSDLKRHLRKWKQSSLFCLRMLSFSEALLIIFLCFFFTCYSQYPN